MSSSSHIDNKKKKSPTKGLKHTLTAKKLYSINFTKEELAFEFALQWSKKLFIC